MSSFMPPPSLTLTTQADLEAHLANSARWMHAGNREDKWNVKSLWLIAIIDEIVAAGQYPYNAEVRRIAEQRLGYPKVSKAELAREGTPLSTMIYNAQQYQESDFLTAQGFRPLTQELIDEIGEGGKLTGSGGKELRIRFVSGKLYAMEPGKRRYAISPQGNPVKVIKRGKRKVATQVDQPEDTYTPGTRRIVPESEMQPCESVLS